MSLLVALASAGQLGGGGGDYGSYLYDKYLEEEAARERQAGAEAQQLRSGQSVVVGISEFDGGTSTVMAAKGLAAACAWRIPIMSTDRPHFIDL